MKITHYSFGTITIDGKTYSSDVIIYPDSVNASWWRKEGHSVQTDDLKEIVKSDVSVLIIGTGYYGVLKVPDSTCNYLKSKGIEVHVCVTGEAVRLHNRLSQKKQATALHLSC